ncbi:MAG TPA: tetratricopeptide repeat protein [Candidatus Dormibacteraeota bacterium]|nr:tetratricopeptide repeat protein [Candidatus Dormibacteraeota bacterium]
MRLMVCVGFIFLASLQDPHSDLRAQEVPHPVRHVRIQTAKFKASWPESLLVEIRKSRSEPPEQIRQIAADIFEFDGVEGETYELTITNEQHDFAQRETLSIGAGSPQLIIRLDPRLDPADTVPQSLAARLEASISTRQLLIPPQAVKQLGLSEKAFHAGDTRTSIEHLQKALQIYPDYAEAHNNLGARYIALDQYDKAMAECERAIALDPNAVKPYQNLTVALALLKSYPQAEVAARRAMQLDPNSVHIRYQLGRILAAREIHTDETVGLLRQAATEIPNARILLVQVLLKRGADDQAVAELREYLKTSNVPNKQQAKCWLAHLTHVRGEPGCPGGTDMP